MIHNSTRPTRRRRGFIAFEWILVITILVIGCVSGLASVRDALISEMYDLADAIEALHLVPDHDEDHDHEDGDDHHHHDHDHPDP